MPQIRILSIGTRLPGWVYNAVNTYLERIPDRYFDISVTEIPPKKRRSGNNPEKLITEESKMVLEKIPGSFQHISLDKGGKELTSIKLAQQMRIWMDEAQDIAFSIGGPEGFPSTHFQHCRQVWSISKLTLAHPVARVVLAEQLYRSYTILAGHPYHRGERY